MSRLFKIVPLFGALGAVLLLSGCGLFDWFGPRLTDRECLMRAMYFESNRSSEEGMYAVGTVVINRLQDARYPKTICGVVGQKNQFARGVLRTKMVGSGLSLAARVADRILQGARHPGVQGAMFFHTAGLTFPYKNMHYVLEAGGNAFYEKR